ncbi:hypothetical protein [Desulforamulus aeronauticus]|uniref:Uncharacterized protein n=1 Tax=Desulforamulus aeronauticus DSM 10349 TaxID=1121421 RepID=A0A1M6P2Z4_9FIRM|nr:hypothetical protein [Desulforamulus aeronauticus]SHK02288.1 hypothetical protein SAMN02745123_00428 [Desulforamulus aeronauticus DSM 10349]
MARKKKKNIKTSKLVQVEKKRDIILFTSASEPVRVPDIVYRGKKQSPGMRDLFVDSSSVQTEISLPLACGDTCSKTTLPVAGKYHKKKNLKFQGAFVPNSCVTQVVSLPYAEEQINKSVKQSLPQPEEPCYQILLEHSKPRKRRKNSSVFVPPSCIIECPTPVYHFSLGVKPLVFTNPYPNPLSLSPDIISERKRGCTKQKSSNDFIPASCITRTVSQPFSKPNQKPIIKYTYVERPNTPDILGPTLKSNKRKKNQGVSFVPKSCIVESTKQMLESPPFLQRTDTLARAKSQSTVEKKSSGNWLSILAFLALIMVVVVYLLQK